ncbi:hypothetical protein BDN70DRAFT_877116, partial [Pholiota conissans]
MRTSLLQGVLKTRFNIPSNILQIPTRRTFCSGLNVNAIPGAQLRNPLASSSPSQVRIGLYATRVQGLSLKGPLSPSPLQRWLSTSSRTCFRDHPRPTRPPSRQILGFLNRIPQNTVFYTIIGLNAIVFGMWFMANQQWQQERDPTGVIWMRQNFLMSWNNITSGRIWTLLTACFSHENLSHILLNGFTFFFMAPTVLEIIGSRQFIFLYLGGGLFSSIISGIYARVTGQKNYSSHGASGAIYSIVTFLACVAPTMKFALYGIIPVPAWLVVSGLFSYDVYSTLSRSSGTTDTVGHIGGVLGGAMYFIGKRFRI